MKRLKASKFNNGKPLLIDDMTDKNIVTKYMGFCKYKNNPVRRIDIRYVLTVLSFCTFIFYWS